MNQSRYRFVDPWEVEALPLGSPLDTPGYGEFNKMCLKQLVYLL